LGGAGGGGDGGRATTAPVKSGVANTGGGGGGTGGSGTYTSGNGGSGIVIIRYPASQSPPTSFGGANYPQINYADGYQIYTWTASGTVTF
jgi:hypothetical protein